MATTNTLKVKASWDGNLEREDTGAVQSATGDAEIGTVTVNFAAGTGAANVINLMTVGETTIAGSGSVTIDLNGGGLKNSFNETQSFTKIRPFFMYIADGTGPARVGGANQTCTLGMGSATSTLTFSPLLIAGRDDSVGIASTGGSADLVVVENLDSSTTMTLQYGFAGE